MGRLAAVATCTLLVAAACQNGDGAARYAKTVAEAVPRIEQSVGLKFKTPPKLEERSKEEVYNFLRRELADSAVQKELAGRQAAYRILGVISDSLELRKLMLDLLTEQVVGYYDPRTKVLYVVKGAAREAAGIVVWHELVHALQDQYVNIDSLLHQRDNDRVTAASALLEGEATIESLQALVGPENARAAEATFSSWDRMRESIRQSKQVMPVFSSAPPFIQEMMLFPYVSGAEFVRRYKDHRAGKPPFVDMLPGSTEQILSSEAYFGTKRDDPIAITLPAPKSGTVTFQDGLGEFEIRDFLFQHVQAQDEAVPAAAGWGGDRYMIVHTPRGDGMVWVSMWDSAIDAVEFTSAMRHAIGIRFPGNGGAGAQEGGTRWDTYARSITLWGGDLAGHPTVIYVDVPKGSPTDLIDRAKVKASR